jgi:hypothetical protein
MTVVHDRRDYIMGQSCTKDLNIMEIMKETIQTEFEVQTGYANKPKLGGK